MSKLIAFTAALVAATTMTSVARADAVRVGFGFPLGSFVAHSNENYSGSDYRRVERPRYVRRDYDDAAPARKFVKRPVQDDDAVASNTPAKIVAQTPKPQDPLASDPSTTTVIAKTDAAATKSDELPVKTSVNTDKIAAVDKPADAEPAAKTATAEPAAPHVCRRYSPAIAALVDVPCE